MSRKVGFNVIRQRLVQKLHFNFKHGKPKMFMIVSLQYLRPQKVDFNAIRQRLVQKTFQMWNAKNISDSVHKCLEKLVSTLLDKG